MYLPEMVTKLHFVVVYDKTSWGNAKIIVNAASTLQAKRMTFRIRRTAGIATNLPIPFKLLKVVKTTWVGKKTVTLKKQALKMNERIKRVFSK
jgi:hypothetical protein